MTFISGEELAKYYHQSNNWKCKPFLFPLKSPDNHNQKYRKCEVKPESEGRGQELKLLNVRKTEITVVCPDWHKIIIFASGTL